jgi:F0F1-type ATP synthase delta subunit
MLVIDEDYDIMQNNIQIGYVRLDYNENTIKAYITKPTPLNENELHELSTYIKNKNMDRYWNS